MFNEGTVTFLTKMHTSCTNEEYKRVVYEGSSGLLVFGDVTIYY